MHSAADGNCGRRPISSADITSRKCVFCTGQPRSSKSTGTCSATGVDVFKVEMKSGLRLFGLSLIKRLNFGARLSDYQFVHAHLSQFAVLLQIEPFGKEVSQHEGHLLSSGCFGRSCVNVVLVLIDPFRS